MSEGYYGSNPIEISTPIVSDPVLAERERCALIAEQEGDHCADLEKRCCAYTAALIASAIRLGESE